LSAHFPGSFRKWNASNFYTAVHGQFTRGSLTIDGAQRSLG